MKWNILAKPGSDILKSLLLNRGLKTKKEIAQFLNPPRPKFPLPGITKALSRIKKAIKTKEHIIVYGDYDADGICATAIMWEALNSLEAKVLPFIPRREVEGYGLSIEGIDNLGDCKLLITVDNGIVANEAVDYAKTKGIDVIVLDHHEKPKKLPKAFAIVHTEKICASALAYFTASALGAKQPALELAAIATITDLMPLLGINRSIVKYGLEQLNQTKRPGLKALLAVAGIEKVGTYEVGFMIGPRLNASGRIENALTALRLLCTKDSARARELAEVLNRTNQDRQVMLEEQTLHALSLAAPTEKIIVIEHESYHQGVIGLIAGKLVEKYYLPAIVIARADGISKASARSISGFNIIEAIRVHEDLLINAGGHPMAAGFSIETTKISQFKSKITKSASEAITPEMLERKLRIDCELSLSAITMDLYDKIVQFAPFGLGNPEPVFASSGRLDSFRLVGANSQHLKMVVSSLDAIAFNQAATAAQLKVGQEISLAYSLDLNTFNGSQTLQLKVKDIVVP